MTGGSAPSSFYGVGYDAQIGSGDLVAAGIITTSTDPFGEIVVAAYNSSGALDTTNFCPGTSCPGAVAGEYRASFSSTAGGGETMSPGSLAIDASGNLFVVGSTEAASCSGGQPLETFVVELSPSGAYNTALGGSGHELISSAASSGSCADSLVANSVSLLSSASFPAIAIAGAQYVTGGGNSSLSGSGTVLGLTSGGAASSTFGGSGVSINGGGASGNGLVVSSSLVDANGLAASLVPGGSTVLGIVASGPVAAAGNTYGVGVTLLASSGSTETGFGSSGVATLNCSVSTSCGDALAVQPDGNFLVGGGVSGDSDLGTASTSTPVENDLSVARLIDQSISIAGPGTLSVSGSATATFTITLNAAGGAQANVTFSTVAGSATSGVNFSPASGTIYFPCVSPPAGVTCQSSTVAVVAVPVLEPSGASGTANFSLALSAPVNAGLTATTAAATLDYGSSNNTTTTTTSPPSTTTTTSVPSSGPTATTSTTLAPRTTPTTLPKKSTKKKTTLPAAGKGYWLCSNNGSVYGLGDAKVYGSVAKSKLVGSLVGIASVPNGTGYWLASSKGVVYPFGSAPNEGSVPGKSLSGSIVAIAAERDGRGYWLASSNGTVYGLGSAKSYGPLKAKLSGTIVAIARTSTGTGYWLLSSTGAVYPFGNAVELRLARSPQRHRLRFRGDFELGRLLDRDDDRLGDALRRGTEPRLDHRQDEALRQHRRADTHP